MPGPAYISQPDGASVYSWGYGCTAAPSGFAPSAIGGASCGDMQIPGPTLIVHQGDTVTVTLTNNLPAAAGNTSILFPGFKRDDELQRPDARRRHRAADQRGCAGRPRSPTPSVADSAGHARLLQRHAGRPAGRDGPLRRHRRAAHERPHRQLRRRRRAARRTTRPKSANGETRLPPGQGGLRPRRQPATTASTCSSSPRWIPRSTGRPRRSPGA